MSIQRVPETKCHRGHEWGEKRGDKTERLGYLGKILSIKKLYYNQIFIPTGLPNPIIFAKFFSSKLVSTVIMQSVQNPEELAGYADSALYFISVSFCYKINH